MVEAKGAITPTLIGHNQKDEHEWKMVAYAELYAKVYFLRWWIQGKVDASGAECIVNNNWENCQS